MICQLHLSKAGKNPLEGLLKQNAGSYPAVSDAAGLEWSQESVFLISFQMMLLYLVLESYFENHGPPG